VVLKDSSFFCHMMLCSFIES